jgi:nucleotidyltransferase/DNA polymerase involved in DNA repair
MGMPMFMAKKEFPGVNYICCDHEKYHSYSKRVMACLNDYSPDIEVVSVDEAYVDLTGTERLFQKNYIEIIKDIRKTILEKTDIPVSIGLSHSNILAKLASDKAKKTGGIFKIGINDIIPVLEKTDIDEVCGIGKANSLTLRRNGVLLASEFVSHDDSWVKSLLGVNGIELRHELLGECVSRVSNKYDPPKSIQSTSVIGEGTFTDNLDIIKMEISKHIHSACSRLRFHKGKCKVMGLMLRRKDFVVCYDKKILVKPTDFELTIQKGVNELLPKLYRKDVLYRSTGVVLEDISYGGEQLSLFATEEDKKAESLSKCIENIETKFGKNSIRTGF